MTAIGVSAYQGGICSGEQWVGGRIVLKLDPTAIVGVWGSTTQISDGGDNPPTNTALPLTDVELQKTKFIDPASNSKRARKHTHT